MDVQKKSAHALEQDRPDILKRRRAWFDGQLDLDPAKLVFIDETGLSTKMARLRGRAPRGERCRAGVPHGHWKTTIFTGALRLTGMTAPFVYDGAMNGNVFLAYVEQVLVPTLSEGDVATQLFEELCVQFPGRFTRKQYKTLVRRVNLWRQAARARGVVVGPKTYRRLNDKPRGRRPEIFKDHWEEMARCLEERPDQTALELLVEFQVRYPGRYSLRHLHTLQKRVRAWRQQAVQRLIGEVSSLEQVLRSMNRL